ncbi:MAG: Calx-beta domain-containing protein [Bacteroidota bacterium]
MPHVENCIKLNPKILILLILFIGFALASYAQPSIGTTSFSFGSDVGLASGNGTTITSASNVDGTGWDFLVTHSAATTQINIIRGDNNGGVSTTPNITLQNVSVSISGVTISSNDGSEFDLTSFAVGSTQGATNYTVTGIRDGSTVSGASFSGSLTQQTYQSGSLTVIDASGDDDFNNIDAFTISFNTPYPRFVFDDITIAAASVSNTPPAFESDLSDGTHAVSIEENSPLGMLVYDVDANDGDGGGTDTGVTYSITTGNTDQDTDNSSGVVSTNLLPFTINATTGAVYINDPGDLDFEGTISFALTIQADDGTDQSTATLTVNLSNQAETGPIDGEYAFTTADGWPGSFTNATTHTGTYFSLVSQSSGDISILTPNEGFWLNNNTDGATGTIRVEADGTDMTEFDLADVMVYKYDGSLITTGSFTVTFTGHKSAGGTVTTTGTNVSGDTGWSTLPDFSTFTDLDYFDIAITDTDAGGGSENLVNYGFHRLYFANTETVLAATSPTVSTTTISTFDASSATVGGNVTADGGASVTERGVVYSSTDATPQIGEAGVTQDDNGTGTGTFSESITGLSASTQYYVSAYAINSEGTSYGSVETFTTSAGGQTIITFDDQGFANSEDVVSAIAAGISGYEFVYERDGSVQTSGIFFDEDNGFDEGSGKTGGIFPEFQSGQKIIISRTDNGSFAFNSFSVEGGFGSNSGVFIQGFDGASSTGTQTEAVFGAGASRVVTLNSNFEDVTSVEVSDNSGSFGFDAILDQFVFSPSTPSNTAPAITGTSAGQTVNDNATISPFSAVTITDSDGDNVTATITLDDNAKGVITGADAGTGPYTMTSRSPAAMQTAIRALSFNPTDNRATVSETITFTIEVDDGTDTDTDATTTVISSAVAPTVTSVSVPGNATYSAGQSLDFTVNFDENVTVNTAGGTPQIAITIGSTTRQATYQSGSGTSALLFRYTVQTGDIDSDGIAVGTLAANGGTLRDAGGADANLTLNSVGSTASVLVDALAPTVNSTSPTDNDTDVAVGNDITITFSENIQFGTGNIQLIDLDDASSTVTIDASSPGSEASISGATLTLNPSSDLEGSTNYAVQIAATAIDDLAGNSFAGISNNTTFNFTTIALPGFTIAESGGSTQTAESGTTDTYTVVLDVQPASNVVINVSSDDTGESMVSVASLTFTTANWDTPQTVTVTGVDDDLIDGTQTVNITLSIDAASSDDDFDALADQIVNVDNTDDDVAGFTIVESVGSTATAESGTTDDFTVELNAEPSSNVVIDVASGDTGEGTADVSSLTFTTANWDTPQTITITGIDDNLVDGTQNFNITLSIDAASSDDDFDAVSDQTVSVDNTDDDVAGFTIVESGGTTATSENGTTDDFTVVLDAEPNSNVVIDISSGDTGEGTVDVASLTFTSANWDTPQTVTVTGVDDALLDDTQTFDITLSINTASSDDNFDALGDQTVSVDNTDDDQRLVSVADGSIAEGNTTATLQFTVTLNFASSGTVTVNYATSDGTATAGDDYSATSGTLTFNAGETSKTVDVTVSGDETVEVDETLTLTLSGVSGDAILGDDQATGTITNDDQATVTVEDISPDEDGTFTLTLSLDNAVDGGFEVDFSTADNTATAGADYTAITNQTLTFAGTANETETVTITVTDDNVVEADEVIDISLSNVMAATVSNGDIDITDVATVTIGNNDQATVSIDDISGNEDDGAITVTATLDNAVDGGFTVDVSTADGTATVADSDYTSVTGERLNFSGSAGETQTFMVTPTADVTSENNETINISMSNLIAGTVATSDIDITDGATATINDDDAVQISVDDPTVAEGDAGTTTLQYTVSLSAPAASTVEVDVATSDGTATAGSDYTAVGITTLTFNTGESSKTVDVTVSGDTMLEEDETLTLTLSDNTGLSVITDATGSGTITNDDNAAVTVEDVSENEDDGSITFTATLDNAVQGGFTVDVSTADGTATTADSDYTAVTGQTLTFSGTTGETQTFTVSPVADNRLEVDETFTVSQSNLAGTSLPVSVTDGATGTITNDDNAAVTIADISGGEDDGPITITATLDNAVNSSFTVDVSTADGTATTADGDYMAITSQTLSFAGNAEETQTFTLTPTADTRIEGDETLTISLDNLSSSLDIDISDQAVVTISDDDSPPTIAASQTFDILEESTTGTSVGNVQASDPDQGSTLQNWLIKSGNTDIDADSNAPFTLDNSSGEITVNDSDDLTGGTSFTLVLTVSDGDNTSAEENVVINVTTVNDAPSFTAGANQIVNEDAGAQTIENWATVISTGPADENNQSLTFNVSNDNASLFSAQLAISATGTLSFTPTDDAFGIATVTVSLSDDGGTANGGDDTSDQVTFTIAVNSVNDAPTFTKGADQTVTAGAADYGVTGWATNISSGPTNESNQQLTFTLTNDNNALFSSQPVLTNSGDLSFAIAADVSGSSTVTITLSDDGGTANGGVDTSEEETFTISVGKLSQEITFAPIDDRKIGQDPIELSATGGDSGNPITYTLSTEPATGVASLDGNTLVMEGVGTITVTASQAGNDTYQAAEDVSVTFSVSQNELFLPTLFSPNGDGTNDFFILRGAGGVATIEMLIFNREGDIVFESTDFDRIAQAGWDGTYQGQALIPGNYVWVLRGTYTNGDPLLVNGKTTGAIRLIR